MISPFPHEDGQEEHGDMAPRGDPRTLDDLYGPVDDRIILPENDRPDVIAIARKALAPVEASLNAAGFYAYGTFDDQHRWSIAVDDEGRHIDVRVGSADFEIELWASSPGLYADEANEFRKRALERLMRLTLPRLSQGMLQPHQSAMWDEVDQGIAVRLRYDLPLDQANRAGAFVRGRLAELDELLTSVEREATS